MRNRNATRALRSSLRSRSGTRPCSLPDAGFDAAILHTVLCHVPDPQRVVAEASRALRPGGRIAVFDGDYNTMSVATSTVDPLEACATAFVNNYAHDPWIVRRAAGLLFAAGFVSPRLRSHGYAQTGEPTYLLSIDRGAAVPVAGGHIGSELAEALKAEARRT